jgi:putative FmdB family regulatory protein
MPIYEYRCSSCGFQKEFLQKVTDPLKTVCPECNKQTFSKMLTAAGFKLKGSGWYATDFRNSGAKPAARSDAKSTTTAGGNDKSSTPTSDGKDKSSTPTSDGKDKSSTTTSDGKDKGSTKSDAKSDTQSGGKSESKTESKSEAVSSRADVRP